VIRQHILEEIYPKVDVFGQLYLSSFLFFFSIKLCTVILDLSFVAITRLRDRVGLDGGQGEAALVTPQSRVVDLGCGSDSFDFLVVILPVIPIFSPYILSS